MVDVFESIVTAIPVFEVMLTIVHRPTDSLVFFVEIGRILLKSQQFKCFHHAFPLTQWTGQSRHNFWALV